MCVCVYIKREKEKVREREREREREHVFYGIVVNTLAISFTVDDDQPWIS